MKAHDNTFKTVLSLGLILALVSTVRAEPLESNQARDAKIDACVAAVREGADLRDALRIRHAIEKHDRRSVGYKFVIDTAVYGDAGLLRKYRSICVVTNKDTPRSFEMHEVAAR